MRASNSAFEMGAKMKCSECGSGSMFFDRFNDTCPTCISKGIRNNYDEGKPDTTVTRTVIEFKKGELYDNDNSMLRKYLHYVSHEKVDFTKRDCVGFKEDVTITIQVEVK